MPAQPQSKQLARTRKNPTDGRVPKFAPSHLKTACATAFSPKNILLDGGSKERFDLLVASLRDEFQPRNNTEHGLVETLAVARWRSTPRLGS